MTKPKGRKEPLKFCYLFSFMYSLLTRERKRQRERFWWARKVTCPDNIKLHSVQLLHSDCAPEQLFNFQEKELADFPNLQVCTRLPSTYSCSLSSPTSSLPPKTHSPIMQLIIFYSTVVRPPTQPQMMDGIGKMTQNSLSLTCKTHHYNQQPPNKTLLLRESLT